MRLIVTRPLEEAQALAARLQAMGHAALVEPLLRVAYDDCALPPFEGAEGIIATSRHGLLALERRPQDLRRMLALPLFAVGESTAAEARRLGFGDVCAGPGGGRELAAVIGRRLAGRSARLIHLSAADVGQDMGRLLAPVACRIERCVVYRMEAARSLSAAVRGALAGAEIDGVLLMSPRTADTYAALVTMYGLAAAAGTLVYYCLSAEVGRRLSVGLGRVAPEQILIPSRPRLPEMLALLAREAKPFAEQGP
jgi:uroporphyrinogen-III synthase